MEEYIREERAILKIAYNKEILGWHEDSYCFLAFWGEPIILGYSSKTSKRAIIKELTTLYKIPKKQIGITKIQVKNFQRFLDKTITILEGEMKKWKKILELS